MPRFSIVTPVYDPPVGALQDCIDSVLAQTFDDWEWCIVDDASPDPRVWKTLQRARRRDRRIRLSRRSTNGGIVAASRDALDMATGEFVALLDHDDLLHPRALRRVNRELEALPDVDYLYTDEDKVDDAGDHYDEFKKPPFDPWRLQGHNYCCHLSVFRSSLLDEIGGFREGFDGSQDYDLILRATERARRVAHVPETLYHWRVVPGSAAGGVDAKPYAFLAKRKALDEHLDRIGARASVSSPRHGFHRVRHTPRRFPRVSVVVPTRGDVKHVWGVPTCLVTNSVRSVLNDSTYPDLEVVIVHDVAPGGVLPDHYPFLADPRVMMVPYTAPFNFADKCNIGVERSSGEIVILLNDDTEVIDRDWIETLVGLLEDDRVGLVGPMLLLDDGRIQSAGHVNDPTPRHYGAGLSGDDPGHFGAHLVTRCVSGVTAACVAMRRSTFDLVGGLSVTYPVSFNDVDLGNKILDEGLRVLWTPLARLFHFESLTRDKTVTQEEGLALERRWRRHYGNEVYSR